MLEGCEAGNSPACGRGLKEPDERGGHRCLITQGSGGHQKLVKF